MTKSTNTKAIPVNIITGFSGVGKTSTILHLLKNKPDNECWAILVNKLGEIGVDSKLLEAQSLKNVFIREVPVGCMCCTFGVPAQVALNQLLVDAKPDRLLVEPTGLGHPKEVMDVLLSAEYKKILTLQKTINLVDARKLFDDRYTNHDIFNQQIAIADTVIGNKTDHYEEKDKAKLQDYVKHVSGSDTTVVFANYGDINLIELEGDAALKK